MPRKRGRPRKAGARDANDRLIPEGKIEAPPPYIAERRSLFAPFVLDRPPLFVSHENGALCPVDNTSDGIGQLWLLGFLDGHGFDDQELRDIGREWRDGYVMLLRKSGYKTGGYERMDKGVAHSTYRASDRRWDKLDSALTGFDRSAMMSLLVDPVVGSWPDGEHESPWVRAIVGEALIAKGRVVKLLRFPDMNDRELLAACIRGLCSLKDASLPGRYERRAA